MHFVHHPEIRNQYPALAAAALYATGIRAQAAFGEQIAECEELARNRLAQAQEGDWPEVQAWRRAFSRMGLKPTQYRCASESLLRRLRKEGTLPRLHPLVDLCNAVSAAHGIPVAALDLDHVMGSLEVRHARGDETYVAFSGEVEHPEPGEVSFVDEAQQAHARRWTHRQSGLSAVKPRTARVLIVAEAMHDTARADLERLSSVLREALRSHTGAAPQTALLSREAPRFDFG
jgi:DNA/RNA-binding domain of Phe-tRNA-synthetase-like protein